jgi:hypothetical protein
MQLLHIDRESSRAPLRFGPADIGTEGSRENSPSQSHYLSPDQVSESQPARVILGSHGGAKSDVLSPERINYLDVQLAAGERWIYEPPQDHDGLLR